VSVFGSIGVAAAERLERSVGPSVALRSYKALLGGAERDVQLRAAEGAFRCALALRDELELAAVSAYWETLVDLAGADVVLQLVMPLLLKGRIEEALIITAAEVKRRPAARSLYLHARALEQAGRDHEDAFRRCAEQADGGLRVAARCKQLEAMIARGAPIEEQLEVADGIELDEATAPQKLLVARVRLSSESKFARAAALSVLTELAKGGDGALARRAVRLAARHADDAADELSWVEADRVAAALSCWESEPEREAALRRLSARRSISEGREPEAVIAELPDLESSYREHLERARAVIAGHVLEGVSSEPMLGVAERCFAALHAIGSENWEEAELSLRALSTDVSAPPPRAAWVVARLALADTPPKGVVLAGLALTQKLLELRATAPVEGYLPFAGAAHRHKATELTVALLRRALRRGDKGARELLVTVLTRRAREAVARGDRSAALNLLQEAKRVAG
jgi:hypothetical protein